MQKELARRLLSATMDWSNSEIEKYLDTITNFAELKYDEYQQYSPGNRFLEHLCAWLSQFSEDDRKVAIEFVLNKLVFISSTEMHRLIGAVYPEIVLPTLQKQAEELCEKNSSLCKDTLVKLIQAKSLFLGLSDGARIDVFRRYARLEHDQVCLQYDFSKDRISELEQKLSEREKKVDVDNYIPRGIIPQGFMNVFLFDDFSGSGISYLRLENGETKGKIKKVLIGLDDSKCIVPNTKFYIVLYLATDKSIRYINNNLFKLYPDKQISARYIQGVHETKLSIEEEQLFSSHYKRIKAAVEDTHYRKGNMDCPFNGFDNCQLALVLHHNTPNNSFPIIWGGEKALFPRVSRHKDNN